MPERRPKVFVGLSGGVDSSTTAYLLKKAGYDVTGVYMKNWSQDIGSYECPWREDYLAAKDLAAFLGLEFLVFDFQKEYKQLVVDYMIEQYQSGYTPNPDIQCNQEIKFKLFFEACRANGAQKIATGHYAKILGQALHRARDERKDQTYFLYRLNPDIFGQILFPLGDYLKTEVRQIAASAGLPNADRAESMGICFVGSVGLADFLKQYIKTEPGPILADGQVVGEHKGAVFYTLGQRHGLNVGGGLPYYVIGKDVDKNEVYASRDIDCDELWQEDLKLEKTHWLLKPSIGKFYNLRLRHGAELASARLNALDLSQKTIQIRLTNKVKAAAAGQSVVLYDRRRVVGGGLVILNQA